MAEPNSSNDAASVQDLDAAYHAFHEYKWDLDKDFLGGLVFALGGYHALAQTAPQADIVMHSRMFYYGRISGITISYAGYRDWLKGCYQAGQQPRIWEWDLLEALCSHRDKLTSAHSSSVAQRREDAAAEKARWMRELLSVWTPQVQPGSTAGGEVSDGKDVSTPAWMAAAPKSELYVDRRMAANGDEGSSPAYPERFAQIIKAIQTGEPVEGIIEIPDIVARNPTTTPIGKMARPLKPWEKAQSGVGSTPDEGEHGLEVHLDQTFPDQEESAAGST
ncbi:hypothetical protein VMCG_04407 [Cytospora schulzeri]|uniref:Uncharacterized protein n=1 Tax=Cytospora schulzeri TaxID=448051 RepID=A0A423WSW9_9PEZI|nr:hypothetical protein VMCG_04407 [Valsa malicola]